MNLKIKQVIIFILMDLDIRYETFLYSGLLCLMLMLCVTWKTIKMAAKLNVIEVLRNE